MFNHLFSAVYILTFFVYLLTVEEFFFAISLGESPQNVPKAVEAGRPEGEAAIRGHQRRHSGRRPEELLGCEERLLEGGGK